MKEEREILDTKSMLENTFLENLKNISPEVRQRISTKASQEMENSVKEEVSQVSQVSQVNDVEGFLIDLYDVRDGLIELFKSEGNLAGKNSNLIVAQIEKIDSCIRKAGGAMEKFDPFNCCSGLKDPDLKLNAQRVIENTKSSYMLGSIENPKISEDGKTINVTFAGKQGDVTYAAKGTLTANKLWTGSEGLDYIYTPGSGKISVKTVNENGKWVDKSSDFNISWELYEMPIENELKTNEGIDKKNIENKKEINIAMKNNEEEDIADFEIKEIDKGEK